MANATGASTTGRQTIVGAFVIGGAALAIGALILFGNVKLFSRTVRAAVVFQDSISGLSIGAPVTFRGVRVGSVESISLRFDPSRHTAYIPVVLQLDPSQIHLVHAEEANDVHQGGVRRMTSEGLRAELNLQSFVTGTSAINLDFAPGSPAVLHPMITDLPEIPARQSAIDKLKATLTDLPVKELSDNANATLEAVRKLSEKLDEDIPPLIASMKQTTDESHDTLTTATHAIADLQKKLDVTLGDVDALMRSGKTQLDGRGADLHAALVSATHTSDEAHAALASMQNMLAPRSADRANLDSALRDAAAAAAALRGFATDVERNPQLLLMGRRP